MTLPGGVLFFIAEEDGDLVHELMRHQLVK
jgi:hypothetical protein